MVRLDRSTDGEQPMTSHPIRVAVYSQQDIARAGIPIFHTPESAGMYRPWLDEGFARPGARRTRADFEIAATPARSASGSPSGRRPA